MSTSLIVLTTSAFDFAEDGAVQVVLMQLRELERHDSIAFAGGVGVVDVVRRKATPVWSIRRRDGCAPFCC